MMRKKIFILLCLILLSCDESLNPYGEFKEKYVLNCVIRADTTFQIAMLTRSYTSNNFDPYSDSTDHSIDGALIRIWNGKDIVAVFKDTLIERPEGDKYKTPYKVYYTNNFKPLPNSTVEIEAILPNGKKLKSSSVVPDEIMFNKEKCDTIIPEKNKDYIKIGWSSNQKNPVFVTRLAIYYFKHDKGKKVRGIADIPLNYVLFNGEYVPDYPKPTSDFIYSVNLDVINKTMELISKGDPVKSNYEILSCIAEVLSLDENLSYYYNSTARGRDSYSVKLDETDYSNIQGGYGVFGVYNKSYWVIRFKHDYIRSFGYIPGLTE